MTPKQEAAKRSMEAFVRSRGGELQSIRLRPGMGCIVASYEWLNDGRIAAIGWAESSEEAAAKERAELGLAFEEDLAPL